MEGYLFWEKNINEFVFISITFLFFSAGILESLSGTVAEEAMSEALTETVIRTLLENHNLLGQGDMLTVLKLMLHAVEEQRSGIILQPTDFAYILKVRYLPFDLCNIERRDMGIILILRKMRKNEKV